jgi:predicted MPP superfamily phosphohydrolase
LEYVRHVVATMNALKPHLIALGGDYVQANPRFAAPCIAELGRLQAPAGRFAVLGNHDHVQGARACLEALETAGIAEVNNRGVWIERAGARLRICGVDDLWRGQQDLAAALGRASRDDAVVLLSHNPDFVESIEDERVGLVLSGHTHGGQIVVPGMHPRWAPTRYGAKYLEGLCQGPVAQVYVTRGAGTTGLPIRFRCRPEVVCITLTRPTEAHRSA